MEPALSGMIENDRLRGRERNKLVTRTRLLECAITLFAEKGYDETSMDEIAEAADVSRATAFNYFPRKREFLEEWSQQRRDTIRKALSDQDPTLHVSAQLTNAFAIYADQFERNSEINRPILRYCILIGGANLTDAREHSKLFAATLLAGQRRGDVRPDLDVDVAGLLLLDIVFAALTRWAGSEVVEPGALKQHLASGLQVVLTGLTVPST